MNDKRGMGDVRQRRTGNFDAVPTNDLELWENIYFTGVVLGLGMLSAHLPSFRCITYVLILLRGSGGVRRI